MRLASTLHARGFALRTAGLAALACQMLAAAAVHGRLVAEPASAQLRAAFSRLEAQLPLTAADHTALKKAALALKVDTLRVCGDPGNLPLSDINGAGFQNKIIELVAAEMGGRVSYFWRPYLMRGITRQTFETGDCDVLLDMPIGFERIITTTPLYKTTYVLAYRNDRGIDIRNLDDPALRSLKIGVFQTSGLRTALTSRGIIENVSLHVVSHNADLKPENQPWTQVQAVLDGRLDVAGVWGPFAGWLKTMKGAPLVVKPTNLWDDETPQEFELTIGLRKVDWVLKYKFDLALEAKKVEIEKILRDYGVPLVKCSKCVVEGDLPAHGNYTKPLAESQPVTTSAASPDQRVTRERLEAWLKDGADITTELANAVLASDAERVKFLIEKGAEISKPDNQGYSALHSAARQRKPAIVKLLIELKADPNQPDKDGFTPLHHAVMRNHPETVTTLVASGANPEIVAADGSTPLAMGIVEDHFKAVAALIDGGAPVDTPVGEFALTPLMLVAGKEGNKLSLGAGTIRVEKVNPRDAGPLEIARALVSRGADVNRRSKSGVTPIMLAAAHNNAPIVGLLAQAGADRNARAADGMSAADIAQKNGNHAVVSLLKLLDQSGNN